MKQLITAFLLLGMLAMAGISEAKSHYVHSYGRHHGGPVHGYRRHTSSHHHYSHKSHRYSR